MSTTDGPANYRAAQALADGIVKLPDLPADTVARLALVYAVQANTAATIAVGTGIGQHPRAAWMRVLGLVDDEEVPGAQP